MDAKEEAAVRGPAWRAAARWLQGQLPVQSQFELVSHRWLWGEPGRVDSRWYHERTVAGSLTLRAKRCRLALPGEPARVPGFALR